MPKQSAARSLESRKGGTALSNPACTSCRLLRVKRRCDVCPLLYPLATKHREKQVSVSIYTYIYIHTYIYARACMCIHIPLRHGEIRYFFSSPRRVERTETCLTLFSVYSLWQHEAIGATARATGTRAMSYPAGRAARLPTALG